MRLFLILITTPLAVFALDLTDQQRADIEARIQPFSAVCVQGEACVAETPDRKRGPLW